MGDSLGALQIIEVYEPSFPGCFLLKLEKGKILSEMGK
ncbi:hypothetical protein C5S35_07940 [Candidatus Methanophagaceae archaeon]|nr:hypothetical protein C5S36_01700 [Methanophagales archaeon]KAF5436672.1 hypothetical protein C5S35_07940 [Methanophagales archaeon]